MSMRLPRIRVTLFALRHSFDIGLATVLHWLVCSISVAAASWNQTWGVIEGHMVSATVSMVNIVVIRLKIHMLCFRHILLTREV